MAYILWFCSQDWCHVFPITTDNNLLLEILLGDDMAAKKALLLY